MPVLEIAGLARRFCKQTGQRCYRLPVGHPHFKDFAVRSNSTRGLTEEFAMPVWAWVLIIVLLVLLLTGRDLRPPIVPSITAFRERPVLAAAPALRAGALRSCRVWESRLRGV